MMTPEAEMDDIIENEICNRLIRLSCAKMVNSKHERGGAKLHRNLLILHLLRRARNEQRRPTAAKEVAEMEEPDVVPAPLEEINEDVNLHCAEDVHENDENQEVFDDETPKLLDLSSSVVIEEPSSEVPIEYTEDCSQIVYQHVEYDVPNGELTEQYDPGFVEYPIGTGCVPSASGDGCGFRCQCGGTDEEQSSSSSSSSSESEEDEGINEDSPAENARPRKRKSPRSRHSSPSRAKKFCVEERQLTGLITVLNTGLSVVSSPLLQQSSEQVVVPSLVHLAYNPLICN